MSREWKPVVGYEGRYSVSDDGRVWSHIRGRELRPAVGSRDQRALCVLYLDGRPKSHYVHRLVCEAFHGPAPEGKTWVLHWDDDPTNNNASNLRWGSPKENSADAWRNGWRFTGGRNTETCKSGLHEWVVGITTTDWNGKYTCRECLRASWRKNTSKGLPEGDPRHGTVTGGRTGCKCELCLPVWKAYRREQTRASYQRKKARDGV